MSDTRDAAQPRRGNFASRKARGETGGSKSSSSSSKSKEHSYDARRYHQNANTHGIHALRTFDCPVCDSRNTIRVTLNPRLGQGTVCCTYCCSLRPAPPDLPYPSVQNFVPSLENKADVFFRFNEQYAALLRQHENERVGESAGLSSCLATVDNTRKRANKDDGESGGRTRAPRGESMDEDGLFGDCALRMDTGLLDNAVDQHVTGAPAMFGSDDDGGGNIVADADPVNPKGVSTPSPPRPDGADMPESNFMNVAVITGVDEAFAAHATDDVNGIGEADAEEVDVAAFFADSD
ncbi:Transcription elongation factor 1 domain-containing protein [Leishmania donovani]|uniref:Transcription_elongation_factor_1_domain-containi ng_protein/GeneDB:LmjF.20.0890 n=1 Tax=Leishmania donovani TaxID=5661 RepID=A0A6J8FCW1_LEIDO|nr:Transcription elongation factor 1 domain-containing protein [Leishmania donovani]VDZ44263.1 Transcription_elongation_factor_1_domain-containing_protein/GeneDB:LmjF.20.0890 [Leishmania donovani]